MHPQRGIVIQWASTAAAAAATGEGAQADPQHKDVVDQAGGGPGGAKKVLLGNAALTKLWNMGGNELGDIAKRQQELMPGLQDYLQPVYEQADPEAGIEEEYKVKNDKAFCWKAFRLIAKKNVGLLSKVSAQGGSLESAVKHLFENKDAGKEEGVVDDKLGE